MRIHLSKKERKQAERARVEASNMIVSNKDIALLELDYEYDDLDVFEMLNINERYMSERDYA